MPLPQLSIPTTVPPFTPDPGVSNGVFSYPPALIERRSSRFAFPGGHGNAGIAPPCRQQGPFPLQGEVTQYPHLKAEPAGSATG